MDSVHTAHGAKPDSVDLPGLLALVALSMFLCCIVLLSMPKGPRFLTRAERAEIAVLAALAEQTATAAAAAAANASTSPGYIVEPADPV
jgi:hypothetical protein